MGLIVGIVGSWLIVFALPFICKYTFNFRFFLFEHFRLWGYQLRHYNEFMTEPVSRMGNKSRWNRNRWSLTPCWNSGLHPILTLPFYSGVPVETSLLWSLWLVYLLSIINFLFNSPDFTTDWIFRIFAESTSMLYFHTLSHLHTCTHTVSSPLN